MPILIVILTATFVSTSSSMAGGLVLYFQGLESLEASVRETSEGETRSLQESVVQVFDKTAEFLGVMKAFIYSNERFHDNNSEEWANLTRSLWYAQVATSDILYDSVLTLYTEGTTNSSMFYSGVWSDVLRNGSKELLYGVYGAHQPASHFVVQNGEFKDMIVQTFRMNGRTGYLENTSFYHWSAAAYVETTADLDPREGGEIPDLFAAIEHPSLEKVEHIASAVWRPPAKWYSSDGNLYAFTELFAAFHPPPPPHPFSTYRVVCIQVGFLYAAFESAFEDYKAARPDTTAVVYGRESGVVYVSTTGEKMISPRCSKENIGADCFLQPSDLPPHAYDAVLRLKDEPFGSFGKMRLDGKEHFVRKVHVHKDLELLWMRPVSSVQGKVEEALNLLIIFTMLVLVFDSVISILEVWYIALPLKRLSRAIRAIGNMETETAMEAIRKYETKRLMVHEIRLLMNGMSATVGRLDEYRTFMPEALLQNTSDGGSSFSASLKGSMSSSLNSRGMRRTEQSQATLKGKLQPATTALNLHLVQKRIAVLLINVVGWARTVGAENDAALLSWHGNIVSAVLSVAAAHTGAVESFQGDRFMLGWNTTKPRSDHSPPAASSALYLKEALPDHTLSCAIACGTARLGNIGTKVLRRFTLLSPIIAWVVELEIFCKTRALNCVCDHKVVQRLAGHFQHRVVDGVRDVKTGRVVPVSDVIRQSEVRHAEEWMYDPDVHGDSSAAAVAIKEATAVNAFLVAVIREDWDAAVRLGGTPSALPEAKKYFADFFSQRAFVPLLLDHQREGIPIDYSRMSGSSISPWV